MNPEDFKIDSSTRRFLLSKLKQNTKWLRENDPSKNSDRMQGAKYALHPMRKIY